MAELLARTSSEELTEWQQYAALVGGLRDHRAELHAARLLALLANVHRRKGSPTFSTEDFMLKEEPRAAAQALDGLAAFLGQRARS